MHQGKLRFYATIKHHMLIRIFVKPLWSALKIKNKANRTKLQDDIANYKKQRSFLVKLNRDSKLHCFENIEISTNSKPFGNESKLYFSDKHAHGGSNTIFNNSNEVIKKETLPVKNDEIAKTFNKHFAETVETLNTFEWPPNNMDLLNDQLTAIKKIENHPSAMKLKSKYNFQEKFSFKPVPVNYVESIIKNIPNNKAAVGEVPLHILNNLVWLTEC